MLESLYMKRRETKLAMQKLVAGAPEGECAEECRTAEESPHLSDMSQDLLKLANRPTFKVGASEPLQEAAIWLQTVLIALYFFIRDYDRWWIVRIDSVSLRSA